MSKTPLTPHALTLACALACMAAPAAAQQAASTLPAALLGLTDRGAIETGRRADLVALDADLRATRTWLAEDWA